MKENGEFKIETLLRDEFIENLIEIECARNFSNLTQKELSHMRFEKLTFNGWWANSIFSIEYKKIEPQLLLLTFQSDLSFKPVVLFGLSLFNICSLFYYVKHSENLAFAIIILAVDLYFYLLISKTSFELRMFANHLVNIIKQKSKVEDSTPFVLNLTRKLEEIKVLRNQGVISEAEYHRLREEITSKVS